MKHNFKHRIHFYEYEEGVNDNGYPVEGWVLKLSLWSEIKTVKGTEFFSASSEQHKNSYRFIIRYNKDVHVRQEIEFENKRYEIESILNDDEQKKTLTIMANIIL